MKKFLKFVLGVAAMAAVVCGVIYFVKKVLCHDEDGFEGFCGDDEDDFDEYFEDEDDDDDREYVTLDMDEETQSGDQSQAADDAVAASGDSAVSGDTAQESAESMNE